VWYWGRLAGIMVRCCHALLAHGHALWQYVDDLLAWWDKSSSPLWASLVVVLLLILAWELLAQFALSFCIDALLPRTRGLIICHQATDNSAADAASAKGLTMTRALAAVLAPYFTFLRRFQVFPPYYSHPWAPQHVG